MANSPSASRPQKDAEKTPGTTCCGVAHEAAYTAREKRENRRKAQPWLVKKFMVVVTAGIMAYAARGVGILYLWMWWAYVKVVLTPPGYARDYVEKSERPLIPAVPNPAFDPSYGAPALDSSQTLDQNSEGNPRNSSHHVKRPSYSATSASHNHASPSNSPPMGGPSYEDLLRRDLLTSQQTTGQTKPDNASAVGNAVSALSNPANLPSYNTTAKDGLSETLPSAHVTDLPPPATAKTSSKKVKSSKLRNTPPPGASESPISPSAQTISPKERKRLERETRLMNLNVVRRPPMLPYLLPAHRYCESDLIVKPYRAHHCRACGTCVLKYDHHCPWIGQCVGARNHKFFLNFCQATVVFTSYTFATLLAYTIIGLNSPSIRDANSQQIVIIALAGLFLLFTGALTVSHVMLILQGQTTVEAIPIRMMREREKKTLARGFKFYEWGAKRRKVREWDTEWGDLNKEGNLWWKGSAHAEWVDVMGSNWLGWFLPVGRPLSDGLSYPPNPRYDSEGRWRRRSEWPEELR
ncbi:hypothetical protein CVT24_010788 [Panaeolus cyanescens]|uniref:Palmitoyltransferase n=1 Tax=Panaeolus cyanescens TaxID=181874 RepID=A0A409VGS3_9AGAR|nr:hypothetical protein CVT24_010788 [Panaeolus cyanescens]